MKVIFMVGRLQLRVVVCTIDRPLRNSNILKGLSKSMSVETRKMMNYACIEQSQEKSWWKFVEILTRKSIFKCEYSGERLIESSSCWFHPKFLAG